MLYEGLYIPDTKNVRERQIDESNTQIDTNGVYIRLI